MKIAMQINMYKYTDIRKFTCSCGSFSLTSGSEDDAESTTSGRDDDDTSTSGVVYYEVDNSRVLIISMCGRESRPI